MEAELDDFKLHDNLVNLNMEKSKASVARLLPSRRPPTRSKLTKTRDDDDDSGGGDDDDEDGKLRNHKPLVTNGLDSIYPIETTPLATKSTTTTTTKVENEKLTVPNFPVLTSSQRVAAAAAAASSASQQLHTLLAHRGHETLSKKKSISDENLAMAAAAADEEKTNGADSWKRNSKTRWSFQYTRSKFKGDVGGGGGRASENGQPADAKSELESVLQRVLRRKGENLVEKVQPTSRAITPEDETGARPKLIEPAAAHPRRKSFVTEKTLQETKQRLRHLNAFNGFGSQCEINGNSDSSLSGGAIGTRDRVGGSGLGGGGGVETDDGICTDSRGESDKDENEFSGSVVNGGATSGASESADSFGNCAISSSAIVSSSYQQPKTDEWYDRRKSYGFEPVSSGFSLKKTIFAHNDDDVVKTSSPSPKTNLSTDSGICRSSELELASTSMVRRLAAESSILHHHHHHHHRDETPSRKIETSPSPDVVGKSADVFELLRKFERRVADEAAVATKPVAASSDSWRVASDLFEQPKNVSASDLWRQPRTPRDDDTAAPSATKVLANDSWIRSTKTLADSSLEPDVSASSKSCAATTTTTTTRSSASWAATTIGSKTRTSADLGESAPTPKGRILEALESLRQSSRGNSFEPHSQLFRRSNDSQEMDDLALKRHSIACDDAKYVMSKFAGNDASSRFRDKLLSNSHPSSSDQLKTTVVNVNGNEIVPVAGAGETTSPAAAAADVKKPKKVEFSKTEVHFAAAEPGKIKIVETDEKPPPANLYRRKKRSVSASPKMFGLGPGYTKFGDYDEHKQGGEDRESRTRTGRRGSFNPSNSSSSSSYTWPGDDSTAAAGTPRRKADFSNTFGSSTCDNGLAVTISSMQPGNVDPRRASWSILDGNEPKSTTPAGYSTKINFGREGVTVIADTKSRKQSAENMAAPNNTDEILEKSHFKPLRMADEKVKTVTKGANVDIKRPKITSVAVNVLRPDDTTPASAAAVAAAAAKKFTTILLNANDSSKKFEPSGAAAPVITGAHDSNYASIQLPDLRPAREKPSVCAPGAGGHEHIIPLRLADDGHHCSSNSRRTYAAAAPHPKEEPPLPHRSRDSSASKVATSGYSGGIGNSSSSSSRAKTDYKPVTIIHHGVRLPDKESAADGRRGHHQRPSSPRKETVGTKPRSRKSVPLPKESKESYHVMGVGGGSLRKKTLASTTTATTASASASASASAACSGKERLFDSGRDSWLNLPKERKSATSGSGGALERKDYAKIGSTSRGKPRSGDATSSDVDSRYAAGSHHQSSGRIPSASGSRRSKTVGLADLMAGSNDADGTDADADADASAAGIMSTTTTYTDASSEDDSSSRRTAAYRKQQFSSKPLTTISEKSRLKLSDGRPSSGCKGGSSTTYAKIRNVSSSAAATAAAGASSSSVAKPSVTRTTSNSSLESRSNSYEFKYPVLKTEERSKRRAARMLQRATSREALLKGGHVSSSEDITSDTERCGSRVASKTKPSRKVKSAKASTSLTTSSSRRPAEATTSSQQQSTRVSAPPRSKANRIIQQRTATMEINIFNIKGKPDDRKRYTYDSSKSQSLRGKKESDAISHPKNSNLLGYSVTKHKNTKDVSISSRVARPVQ